MATATFRKDKEGGAGDDDADQAAVKLLPKGSGDDKQGSGDDKQGSGDDRQTPKKSGEQHSRLDDLKAGIKENKWFTGCVVLNILLIIVIFGVTIGWLTFAQTEVIGYDPDPKHLFCLKCEKLGLSDDEKQKYFGVTDPKKTECCAGENGVEFVDKRLSKIVREKLNEKFKDKPLFQLCMNSTTAEHPQNLIQVMNIKTTEDQADLNLKLIMWETANPIKVNIDYWADDPDTKRKGGYQVKRAGYYSIYSNLVFKLPANENSSLPVPDSVIRHLVIKYRKDYNVGERLLEGYSTLCYPERETMFNSYISGNFFLEDTDIVKVFVNNPTYLAPYDSSTRQTDTCDAGSSFFGMYLI